MMMTGVASLSVGFVIGWIVACPRRWDAHFCDGTAHGHDVHHVVRPAAGDPDAGDVTGRAARGPIRARLAQLLRLTGRA
ncbi:hypothetical protein [Actinomadura oligospora]|uniref:hypothetical protein n=1 Tax=Actinomadura oligospora TaxID=111804 RepID=UPI0012F88739|nr:hypothetical protein [Actinomadura oligospora]